MPLGERVTPFMPTRSPGRRRSCLAAGPWPGADGPGPPPPISMPPPVSGEALASVAPPPVPPAPPACRRCRRPCRPSHLTAGTTGAAAAALAARAAGAAAAALAAGAARAAGTGTALTAARTAAADGAALRPAGAAAGPFAIAGVTGWRAAEAEHEHQRTPGELAQRHHRLSCLSPERKTNNRLLPCRISNSMIQTDHVRGVRKKKKKKKKKKRRRRPRRIDPPPGPDGRNLRFDLTSGWPAVSLGPIESAWARGRHLEHIHFVLALPA